MNGATLTLKQADDSTLPYIETLLERNDLPAQDVRATPEWFYVAYTDAAPVGIGGVERYGPHGLLRSVVIERTARGNGFGTALCEALENTAAADGIETLYLLTTTAVDFFTNHGYSEHERATVPATIQQTTEFDSLCPTTATCLKKPL
ncbi:GNAT family N-acetyltransferase [Halocatena pleomorpha]|uniref:GNAT family N-acetyltransferase n=2 Tax=Halocatena pleomorpha TaxID=1785090 RepID=A0A3P3RLA9_9EURY|nr:GNAT family N-acetyltransferase [Halocatena pleomorpha]